MLLYIVDGIICFIAGFLLMCYAVARKAMNSSCELIIAENDKSDMLLRIKNPDKFDKELNNKMIIMPVTKISFSETNTSYNEQ